jgi:hypothetical protein
MVSVTFENMIFLFHRDLQCIYRQRMCKSGHKGWDIRGSVSDNSSDFGIIYRLLKASVSQVVSAVKLDRILDSAQYSCSVERSLMNAFALV